MMPIVRIIISMKKDCIAFKKTDYSKGLTLEKNTTTPPYFIVANLETRLIQATSLALISIFYLLTHKDRYKVVIQLRKAGVLSHIQIYSSAEETLPD